MALRLSGAVPNSGRLAMVPVLWFIVPRFPLLADLHIGL
jgi:hypothetical protein